MLIVPSQDRLGVRDIHSGMAAFRAVENGMTVFRQTGQGVSLVTDAYGNILNRVDTFEESTQGFAGLQRVTTPIGSVTTLYPTIGDRFGHVVIIGSVGMLTGLVFTRRRS